MTILVFDTTRKKGHNIFLNGDISFFPEFFVSNNLSDPKKMLS